MILRHMLTQFYKVQSFIIIISIIFIYSNVTDVDFYQQATLIYKIITPIPKQCFLFDLNSFYFHRSLEVESLYLSHSYLPALSMAFGKARNPEPAMTPTINTHVVRIFSPFLLMTSYKLKL